MQIAITRQISRKMQDCELTHFERTPIDLSLARQQHAQYEQALAGLGCEVITLVEQPDLPDSVFVEDVAIVLDEIAILTRPGAESRRAEVESVAEALAPYRRLVRIEAPGTLDGGDVLRIDKNLYIGITLRSNAEAIEQVRAAIAPLGYRVVGVPVTGCLHLKSAVTQAARDAVLLNPAWVDGRLFAGMRCIEVDPREPYAANCLLVGDTAVYPTAYPYTRQRLEQAGIALKLVDASEVAKAEGAVTCCSLVFAE